MTSALDICNLAFSHIGHDANVTSIDPPEGTVEAGYAAQFYPIARAAALEASHWTFARARADLVETPNPSSVWTYAYTKPSDCLRAVRVLALNSVSIFRQFDDDGALVWALDERSSATFETEGELILSNEPDAVLFYIKDQTETTRFSPMFVIGVSELLGGMLAGPVIRGSAGRDVGTSLRKQGMATLAAAAALDARRSAGQADHVPAHIRARQ